ncbi:MAG TPA: N-acetylmuramoyl-L-alanine amidase, partial [Verrucomicrobiae bacterium]
TRSANNRDYEKNLALDWALRLRPLLEANGWKVYLTRSDDSEVSLADRVALADRVKADFFLSLHFNSATPNTRQAGVETFCLTPVGMPSSLVRDFEDDPKHIFPNNAFDAQNVQFAYRLHRAVLQCTQAADRGVRRARFMGVVRGQRRPAVLIEGGYLSNPAEARKIASAAYRQALAEAVGRALD